MSRWVPRLLLVALLVPAGALGAGAQEEDELTDEFALLEEENTVFTAAKHEQDILESPSAITVITREQIVNTHCTDVICLLRQVPEVEVLRVLPNFASVGARSMITELGNKALLIIDGREFNLEVFGIPFWQALNVHLEDIERIEVIRGPGSALYGANAHSMVVSITTLRTQGNSVEVFLGAGELDRNSLHLRADQVLGDWKLHLSGGLDTAGSWSTRDLRDRETGRLRLRAVHEGQDNSTEIQLGLISAEGGFFTLLAPGQLNDGLLTWGSVIQDWEMFKAKVSFLVVDGDVIMDMPLEYNGIEMGTMSDLFEVTSANLDVDLQVNFSPFEGNLMIAGGNYRFIGFFSEHNQPDEVYQHRVGLFLHDEQRLFDQLFLTAGLRLDYNNITPFTFSPRAAVVWKFSRGQILRLAFGQAFLKPSFFNTSLHPAKVEGAPGFENIEDFFKENIGNENLGNEQITTFEVGYAGHFLDGSLTTEANCFYNRYRDFIMFNTDVGIDAMGLPDLDNTVMEFDNTGLQVDAVGGSVSLTLKIRPVWRLHLNYSIRYIWYTSDPVDIYTLGDKQEGDRVLWVPMHLANAGVHYLPASGLRAGVSAHYTSGRELAMLEYGEAFDDRVLVELPGKFLVGGFFSWRVPMGPTWIEAGIRAYNLLNNGYRDVPAVTRRNGGEFGGQLVGRRIFFFLRGAI